MTLSLGGLPWRHHLPLVQPGLTTLGGVRAVGRGHYAEGVTSSVKLRKRLADLTAFVNALNELLEVTEPMQVTYSGPATFVPRNGMEGEASRRRLEVDRAAGRAAYAFAEAGSIIDWKPRGTMQTQPVNPATIWATILDGDPIVPVSLIFSCAAQATGVLEMKIESAEEEERNPRRERTTRTERAPSGGSVALWSKIWGAIVGVAIVATALIALAQWQGWGL
jgi:hypothetical protein